MALKITVEISIADDKAYTEREAAIISAMQSHPAGTGRAKAEEATTVVHNTVTTPAPAKAAPAKPAPKAAPAKPSTTRAAVLEDTPEPAVEEPEEAVEEVEEDLVGGGDLVAEFTLDDAVSLATKLVSDGKAADVKKALAKAGAKRVSELDADGIATFMGELKQ